MTTHNNLYKLEEMSEAMGHSIESLHKVLSQQSLLISILTDVNKDELAELKTGLSDSNDQYGNQLSELIEQKQELDDFLIEVKKDPHYIEIAETLLHILKIDK